MKADVVIAYAGNLKAGMCVRPLKEYADGGTSFYQLFEDPEIHGDGDYARLVFKDHDYSIPFHTLYLVRA